MKDNDRFPLSLLRGLLDGKWPPAFEPLEHSRRPSAKPEVSGYHNKTIRERWLAWKALYGRRVFRMMYNALSVAVCLALVSVLFYMVSCLPGFGTPDHPSYNEVAQRYLRETVRDTGAVNAVAGMIFDYRGFDTFGESCTLFTAVCAVLILLRREGPQSAFDALLHEMEEPRMNLILKNTAFLLVSMIMIFGCYVILNGHLSPGGGFSGGAILGASLILYASAYGTRRARRFINYNNFRYAVVSCLVFYALAKGYVFCTGANGLATGIPKGKPGALLSAGLILPLNIAVGLTVACGVYVIYILFSKGELR